MIRTTTEFAQGETTPGVGDSQRYHLLADDRRRTVVAVLHERGDTLDLDGLADAVATRESGERRPAETTAEQVRISLHHVHLPKLADAGVCQYDPANGRVDVHRSSLDGLLDE